MNLESPDMCRIKPGRAPEAARVSLWLLSAPCPQLAMALISVESGLCKRQKGKHVPELQAAPVIRIKRFRWANPTWSGGYIFPSGSGVSVKGLNMHEKDTHKHPSSFAADAACAPLRANCDGAWEAQILLTVEELAEILRVPKSWIYSHQDQLPTVRLGRYVRFKRSEIESFLEQQKAC
jgi:excisionase family DNA binding protein